MSCILHPGDPRAAGQLGGKAGALASLEGFGFPIPPWFVVTPDAFHQSLSKRQRQELENAKTNAGVVQIAEAIAPDESICAEIARAVAELCPGGGRVAVRSSAGDEDSPEYSFAGQLDSFLFVAAEEVSEKVAAVWRSAFSERILAYRREHGLSLSPQPPAVLVQRMVESDVSGVAFGADPVTGRRGVAIVAALYGLGTTLVSGESDADTFEVDREGRILRREIANKRFAHRFDSESAEGVAAVRIPEQDANKSALTDSQILEVAALVRRAGNHFGRPQDMEWAYEKGRLYLLQSRPITSLRDPPDPEGALNIWDNSNIAESYSGVTTPLTFSFARSIYEGVYRQFCRIMRVPEGVIAANDEVFARMLGLIRGRVYYNLLSWYRVLAMFPGFTVNRRFMEQMMGVREPLPDEIVAQMTAGSWGARVRDGARVVRTVGGLIRNHFVLERRIEEFYVRLNAALAPPHPPLEDIRADELAGYYLDLERRLLTRWDAPLVNDFFAMIFHGLLRALAAKWCGSKDGALASDLARGQSAMISAEPAERVCRMAALVANDDEFAALLCEGSLGAILRAMQEHREFRAQFESYLEKFGDRCLEELKLESPTLHDDPLLLFRSVGQLARGNSGTAASGSAAARASESNAKTDEQVRKALAWHPIRRVLFRWVLRNARARVLQRENLRFERTRLFGRVRRIFVELGRRLHSLDRLDEPRDIFYLQVEEILGFIQGTATTVDLKGLVALRKREFEGYKQSEPPDDRFETRGVVYQSNSFRNARPADEVTGDERKGIGCCSGVVRGPVRVITDPRNAVLKKGCILVAERTDPGWILLFPSAAGLLVERGSLLSHSAIVAREMGIPAIVSLSGVTRWLKDGDWVELDGGAGVVRRISAGGNAAHE
ncbi:MAG: PEP/pyruvate-binding domain-containing protein [Candidatus Acidiferrales bacterium]